MLGAAAERICIDAHKTCTQKRRAVGLARCDRFVGRGFALDHDILIVELVADRGFMDFNSFFFLRGSLRVTEQFLSLRKSMRLHAE